MGAPCAYSAGRLTASQCFDVWDNRTKVTGSAPLYGCTGRGPVVTASVFYRARYCHPGKGCFAFRDPMGMVDPTGWLAKIVQPGSQSVHPNHMATDWMAPACGVGDKCAQ